MSPFRLVAGVDEAGRGPLAGPVIAAAVILDPRRPVAGLADSKRLTERARERLEAALRERALAIGIGLAGAEEIDAVNILQATFLAMRRALQALGVRPARVRVDGNALPPAGDLGFAFNTLGVPLAAGLLYPFTGWLLSPMFAALAMSLSSASVVGNALRLRGHTGMVFRLVR